MKQIDRTFRSLEDVLSLEVKNNTLNNVKSKLESSMDDLEDELLMEKKSKTILEKEKRRLEGDLARCLEVVEEKEKETGAVRQSLTKREKELSHLVAKLEEEQQVILRNVRQVKELAGRVETLEEELDTERQQRVRAEQQKTSLNQERDSSSINMMKMMMMVMKMMMMMTMMMVMMMIRMLITIMMTMMTMITMMICMIMMMMTIMITTTTMMMMITIMMTTTTLMMMMMMMVMMMMVIMTMLELSPRSWRS